MAKKAWWALIDGVWVEVAGVEVWVGDDGDRYVSYREPDEIEDITDRNPY